MRIKITSLFILLFLAANSLTLKAQTNFEVPENVVLESEKDYDKYEADIIAAAKWLEETDWDTEEDKRKQVNAFVVVWISGSPSVTIGLTTEIIDICEKNDGFLGLYLASYARYVLEHKTEKGAFAPTKAAIKSLVTVYNKGKKVKKNKLLKKAAEYEKEGKLDDFITEMMKVEKD